MDDVRLIDADKAIAEIKRIYCGDCDSHNGVMCRVCGYMDAMDIIDDAPATYAQPVKQGRWIKGMLDGDGYHCSECRVWKKQIAAAHYCPNCGAEMNGGDDHA